MPRVHGCLQFTQRDEVWMVEVDPKASIAQLMPELIETLPVDGTSAIPPSRLT